MMPIAMRRNRSHDVAESRTGSGTSRLKTDLPRTFGHVGGLGQ